MAAESFSKMKPTAIVGVSGGPWGTVRAQLPLRQTFVFTGTPVLPKPELFVTNGRQRFDERANLDPGHDDVRDRVAEVVTALMDWARTLAG